MPERPRVQLLQVSGGVEKIRCGRGAGDGGVAFNVLQFIIDRQGVVHKIVVPEHPPALGVLLPAPQLHPFRLEGVVFLHPEVHRPPDAACFHDKGAHVHVGVADGGGASLYAHVNGIGVGPGGAHEGHGVLALPHPQPVGRGRHLPLWHLLAPDQGGRQQAVAQVGGRVYGSQIGLLKPKQGRVLGLVGKPEQGRLQLSLRLGIAVEAGVGVVEGVAGGGGHVQQIAGGAQKTGLGR